MARIQGKVSAGSAGKEGGGVQAVDSDAGTPTAMGNMGGQFRQVNIDAVHGRTDGVSRSGAAPQGDGGSPVMPGAPLAGHSPVDPRKVKGHAVAKRSAGRSTQAGDIDKLSTAGA